MHVAEPADSRGRVICADGEVDGKLEGSKASGMLSGRKGTAFGTDCRATGISWHAEAQPGSDGEAA